MSIYAIVITIKATGKRCVLNERYTDLTEAIRFGATFTRTLKDSDIDADFAVCELK